MGWAALVHISKTKEIFLGFWHNRNRRASLSSEAYSFQTQGVMLSGPYCLPVPKMTNSFRLYRKILLRKNIGSVRCEGMLESCKVELEEKDKTSEREACAADEDAKETIFDRVQWSLVWEKVAV